MSNLKDYIERGLSFIAQEQQSDGSFLSISSSDKKEFSPTRTYTATFITSLILSALESTKGHFVTHTIQKRGIRFLLHHRSPHWSWNYWKRASQESQERPYPDDLDDTFCALVSIALFQPKLLNGEVLAHIVNLLTHQEEKEGGPYRTWVAGSDLAEKWQDVDLAVNSNVAYFLSLNNIHLENLQKFIETKIERAAYHSPYYPSAFPIIYFIARFYRGPKKKKLINYLRSHKPANILEKALATSALLRLGVAAEDLTSHVQSIIKHPWSAYPFCIDPVIDGKKHFAGSKALTAACCLEAVALYQKRSAAQETTSSISTQISTKMVEELQNAFISSGFKLGLEYLERIRQNDTDQQIMLLPYFFRESLETTARKKIPDDLVIRLGAANVYGWIAYRIYDDFLDQEGDPLLLPLANHCLRALTTQYRQLLPNEKHYTFFLRIMDEIDIANVWEQQHCRFDPTKKFTKPSLPSYKDYVILAKKSLGHAMGPITILLSLGYPLNSPEVTKIRLFFEHYIIARQLNDDAHDWLEDFERGFINPASARILKHQKQSKAPSIREMTEEMQQIFWHQVIPGLSADILKQLQTARHLLHQVAIIEDRTFFEKILEPLERSAKLAASERKRMLSFLKSYSSKST